MQIGKVLLIDADPASCRLIREALAPAGAVVMACQHGWRGLDEFDAFGPDLVLLELDLPYLNGLEVCHQIRRISEVPIIFVSEQMDDESIVRGLDCGAVDFVPKPFNPRILRARVRAALRQSGPRLAAVARSRFRDDWLHIDLGKRSLAAGGRPVQLSKREYALLAYLVRRAGLIIAHQELQRYVWQYRPVSVTAIHACVSRLRQKLEPEPGRPRYLLTRHGVGYYFEMGKLAGIGQ